MIITIIIIIIITVILIKISSKLLKIDCVIINVILSMNSS